MLLLSISEMSASLTRILHLRLIGDVLLARIGIGSLDKLRFYNAAIFDFQPASGPMLDRFAGHIAKDQE